MSKRWIALYVENDVGVLAKIAGLFSGKSYNMESLTVGPTEDETMSRVTISVDSDDATFEQIKKQLNRCVEVITVIDLTHSKMHMKELMFVKVSQCNAERKLEICRIAEIFGVSVVDYGKDSIILECVLTEEENDSFIQKMQSLFGNVQVVRGGGVAIEAIK